MAARRYIDVHILQTVPPANLNRDDQGNPKEAFFGGVRRSRVVLAGVEACHPQGVRRTGPRTRPRHPHQEDRRRS